MHPVNQDHAAQVRSELNRILLSPPFEKAKRSQRFIAYLVEAALSDPPVPVKEYTLAVDVFDRPARYDPNTDATVRVEAGLESEAGVTIDLPKGGYAVTFSFRSSAADGNADVDERSSEDRSGQLPEEYLGSLSSMPPMDRATPDSGIQHGTPETLQGSPPQRTPQPLPSPISQPLIWTVLAICIVVTLFGMLLREERSLRRAKADLLLKASHAEVTVTPLTALQGMKFAPTFSPDGSQVAFAWDGVEPN